MTSPRTTAFTINSAYSPGAVMAGTLEPVAPWERIHGLDLLRGFAMFGVMWSNLNDWYFTTDPATRADRAFSFAQDWIVEGRFYSLLCFLFGIGFAIQLTRAMTRGVDLRNVYLRRSAALLGIGLIHALLIWHGDVLVSYALASFGLLMFRNRSPREQLVYGIVLAASGTYIANHIHWALGQIYVVPEKWGGGTPAIYATGSLAAIQRMRFHDVWHWWGFFGLGSFFSTVGSFLVGAWAYRSGLVERAIANRRATLKLLGIAAIVLVVGYSIDALHWDVKLWPRPKLPATASLAQWAVWNPRSIVMALIYQTEKAGAVVYACLLLLVFQTRRGQRLLAPLVATGRMGLTTYLTQSVVCTTLFYSYGLGWFGKVGYTGMFEITAAVFAVQLVVSTWWMKRFRFGPVEWVWRAVTYGKAPRMRGAG
jgi:uncharacterized protein